MRDDTMAAVGREAHASEQVLLVTKLATPAVGADVVPRQRLVDRLNRGSERPLTLVAAPAGFGKTTLLAAWLAQAAVRAAWVALEPGDDDLSRFWTYVFGALDRVQPGSGAPALALLLAAPLQQQPPIEAALSLWINALADLPDTVALVLDDYHVIGVSAIHHSVTFLLDHLPPRLRLVLATRADPPLPLARLRARGQLSEIREADLRFSADEAAAFLARTHGLALDAEDIAALAARTEGWIAGLQLAALSLHGREDIPGFLRAFAGSHHYIIDYLTEEVLARQPEPVQRFLLRTAILDRLHRSLCAAVMDEPNGEASGGELLEQVEQANLFLVPLDDERRWYRYHQLFADALRHHLRRTQPALVPELHRRASVWYARQGLAHDAVQHALAASDYALAGRLIEGTFEALVRRGEIATLQRWMAALPAELVRENIELAVLRGWLLFVGGRHDDALRHLEEMERTFALDQASSGDSEDSAQVAQPSASPQWAAVLGRIAAIRATIALTRRDLPRAVALSQLALDRLPREYMARSYVAGYLGKARYLRGEIEAARVALEEACRVSQEVRHTYGLFLVTYDLAQLHIQQGRPHQAELVCRRALEQASDHAESQPACGPALVIKGHLEREWNQLDAASALLREGIALCEQTANTQVVVWANAELALVRQAQGDGAGAQALMRQAMERAEAQRLPPPRGAREIAAYQAWLDVLQGDLAAAGAWAEQCGLAVDQEFSHLREREYLTLARIRIAQGKLDEALRWLAGVSRLAEAQGRTGSAIEVLTLQAVALWAAGRAEQAAERLARALGLAEPAGYVRLFVDEGAPIAQLLRRMRQRRPAARSGSARYRERLLRLLDGAAGVAAPRASGPGPEPGLAALAEPLSERELEILRLIAAGGSNQEIAGQLVLALSTVKWYINALYGKLQVASRTQAVARARELRLL